jgi:hypothetical protein
MILSLQEKLGCSHEYILWEESWTNLQMKIADAPRIASKSAESKPIETEGELIGFLDKHV